MVDVPALRVRLVWIWAFHTVAEPPVIVIADCPKSNVLVLALVELNKPHECERLELSDAPSV